MGKVQILNVEHPTLNIECSLNCEIQILGGGHYHG
jgi:hypothetical protein